MAESEADIGFGSEFAVGDGSTPTEAFTAIAEVVDIDGPDCETDDVEQTHMKSPDGFKEFTPGLVDGGEFTLTLNYTKGNTTALYNLFRTKKNFKVTNPDTSTWVFSGYIKSFGAERKAADKMQNTATFKVSGKPVWTAAA